MTVMRVGAITHVGQVRKVNQDGYLIRDSLLAVADGMGGHQAGEVASSLALKVIAEWPFDRDNPLPSLQEAAAHANLRILRLAEENQELAGMGTTLSAALVMDKKAYIAHIGDSRIYRWDGKKLHQLTEDHSIVAELVRSGALSEREALVHPHRNVLTRSLGTAPQVFFDLKEENLDDGDILVLCTDGLYSLITEDELGNILTSYADPQQAAERLVELANERGGHDNITALVAAMGE